MMAVVAKFFCSEIVRHENAPTADRVKFGAVCRGRENSTWASATPSGNIEMRILNDAATDYFEQGSEYLVTFTKVEKPQFGDGHQPIPKAGFGKPDDLENAGYVTCEFCGVNAVKDSEGNLDWSTHEEHYGAK